MRRILAISVLAAILVLVLSVPAFADPPDKANCSDPPNAYGEYNTWLVEGMKDYGLVYGRDYLRPIMWAIWGGHGSTSWDNGGEYIAFMKDVASY